MNSSRTKSIGNGIMHNIINYIIFIKYLLPNNITIITQKLQIAIIGCNKLRLAYRFFHFHYFYLQLSEILHSDILSKILTI